MRSLIEEMPKHFTIEKEGESLFILSSKNKKVIASLEILDWLTGFFKRKFGSLTIDHHFFLGLPNEVIHTALGSLLSHADEYQYHLLELHLDISGVSLIPILEDKGFRLVDTRATFVTLMEKEGIDKYSSDIGTICFASESDLKSILHLTHENLTYNRSFVSRFKNRTFFTQEETERYYSAYIENYLYNY